jgi:hypothetical protein
VFHSSLALELNVLNLHLFLSQLLSVTHLWWVFTELSFSGSIFLV